MALSSSAIRMLSIEPPSLPPGPRLGEDECTRRTGSVSTRRGGSASRPAALRSDLRFVVEGEAEQAVAPAQLQFVRDAQTVGLYGAGAALQDFGDLLAAPVLGNEPQDLALGDGEPVQACFLF